MSYGLTEEQQLIQQNAGEFAREYVAPAAAEMDHSAAHPADLVRQVADMDLCGIFLPEEYGGADAGYLSYLLVVEELAKASGALAAVLINHCSLVMYALNRWGTPAQKETYLPELTKATKLGAFALHEPGHAPGSGPDRVTANKEGDHYVLNGKKCFVANGGAADLYLVFAAATEEGAKGLSAFLVAADTPGFSVARQIEKMGLRGCQSAELVLDNVKVPATNLLGTEGAGQAIAAAALAVAAIAEGAQMLGIAQAAMEDAAKYAKQRVQFGRPIASFPAIQNMLAEMATHIHLARLAVYHAGQRHEQGESVATEAAMIKLFSARIGQSALIDVVQIEGGYGYSEEMIASRLYRDVKGTAIMESLAEYPEKVIAGAILA